MSLESEAWSLYYQKQRFKAAIIPCTEKGDSTSGLLIDCGNNACAVGRIPQPYFNDHITLLEEQVCDKNKAMA